MEVQTASFKSTENSSASPALPSGRTVKIDEGFAIAKPLSAPLWKLFTIANLAGSEHALVSLFGMRDAQGALLSPTWFPSRNTARDFAHIVLQKYRSPNLETGTASSIRLSAQIASFKVPATLMLFASFVGSAAANDNEIALAQYTGANMIAPDPRPRIQLGLVATYILVVTGLLTTTMKNLLGPLMGISSVLWFIMRNDAAIKPSISWA